MIDGSDRKIYNSLVMLTYLMDVTCVEHYWKQRLTTLLAEHSIDVSRMGFPADWAELPIWQAKTY